MSLCGAIEEAEQESARRSRPEDFSAYELYLAARSELPARPREVSRMPSSCLRKPSRPTPGSGADPADVEPAALAEAQRAVDIDPLDAAAHAALAWDLG